MQPMDQASEGLQSAWAVSAQSAVFTGVVLPCVQRHTLKPGTWRTPLCSCACPREASLLRVRKRGSRCAASFVHRGRDGQDMYCHLCEDTADKPYLWPTQLQSVTCLMPKRVVDLPIVFHTPSRGPCIAYSCHTWTGNVTGRTSTATCAKTQQASLTCGQHRHSRGVHQARRALVCLVSGVW